MERCLSVAILQVKRYFLRALHLEWNCYLPKVLQNLGEYGLFTVWVSNGNNVKGDVEFTILKIREEQTMNELKVKFKKIFEAEADYVFSAAGRVNLIGEHVDYCGGQVLPAALSLKCQVAVRKNGTNLMRIAATTIQPTT